MWRCGKERILAVKKPTLRQIIGHAMKEADVAVNKLTSRQRR
jgi:hypothetical protein